MVKLKIAVEGTDGRFEYLRRILKAQGHELVNELERAELVVTNYPPNSDIPEKCNVAWCGPKKSDDGRLDIMKDETYMEDVAYLTAEGALAAAMMETPHTIRGASCMVIGWGRIGRALTRLLAGMGARVTVLSRRSAASDEIINAGARPEPTEMAAETLPGHSVVFSTPPAMVLDAHALKYADKNAALIDLASPPYGIDLEFARQLGLHAWREPALPGRYCPQSAAKAIYDALIRGGVINE